VPSTLKTNQEVQTMYTSPKMLKVRNLDERMAAATLMAMINKEIEKDTNKKFSVQTTAPILTKHGIAFIKSGIKKCHCEFSFDQKNSLILAEISPR